MNLRSKLLGTTFLLAAVLFPSAAQAMPIWQFDKMADQDQADYIQVLVDGAQKVLKDEGRSDLANKMDALFTEVPAGDKISLGMEEFEDNLALARVYDAKRVINDPNARRLEVEDVMFLTLKKNGIILPKNFMHVGDNFHPKSSLVRQNPDGTITVQRRPPNGAAKDVKAKMGLAAPAQIVVLTISKT